MPIMWPARAGVPSVSTTTSWIAPTNLFYPTELSTTINVVGSKFTRPPVAIGCTHRLYLPDRSDEPSHRCFVQPAPSKTAPIARSRRHHTTYPEPGSLRISGRQSARRRTRDAPSQSIVRRGWNRCSALRRVSPPSRLMTLSRPTRLAPTLIGSALNARMRSSRI
jgi:hypothetical protein